MTNAKISDRARAVLRNKSLASAIAMALVENSGSADGGVVVNIAGKDYTIRIASSLTQKDLQKAGK